MGASCWFLFCSDEGEGRVILRLAGVGVRGKGQATARPLAVHLLLQCDMQKRPGTLTVSAGQTHRETCFSAAQDLCMLDLWILPELWAMPGQHPASGSPATVPYTAKRNVIPVQGKLRSSFMVFHWFPLRSHSCFTYCAVVL